MEVSLYDAENFVARYVLERLFDSIDEADIGLLLIIIA